MSVTSHGPARSRRWHVWLSRFGRPAGALRLAEEPRWTGRASQGRQMVERLAPRRGDGPGGNAGTIRGLFPRDPEVRAGLHAFDWLDDLAALGDRRARACARDGTAEWIRLYGACDGAGWDAAITGRRLVAWTEHGAMILDGAPGNLARAFRRSLTRQTRFLARRWRDAAPGRARFDALAGLLHGAMALEGMERHAARAAGWLDAECAARIGAKGEIASRDPEELMEILRLLSAARGRLEGAGVEPPPALCRAVTVMAAALRTLRHADGGLPRFHGGGAGSAGRAERVLALSGVPTAAPGEQALGFARLSHRRVTLLLDAAPPPAGPGTRPHASTLAFELTSGRRPLVVGVGPGQAFGADWAEATCRTPSHSTLELGADTVPAPVEVRSEWRRTDRSTGIVIAHDGYVATHGLTHIRQLHLDTDGRSLHGEDVLAVVEREDRAAFDAALLAARGKGLLFRVRFHLHPDVLAAPGEEGGISLMLRSGELWRFGHDGAAALALESGVYLDAETPAPRETLQIVLTGRAEEYATRVSWTLAKARQTPDAIRDLVHDDAPILA